MRERLQSLRVLGFMKSAELMSVLPRAFREGEPRLRLAAVLAVREAGLAAAVPLLVLTALIVGARDGFAARHRTALACLAGILLVATLLTQSRSGLLGIGVGVVMLLCWYRKRFFNRQVVVALVILGAAGLVLASAKTAQLEQLIASRTSTSDRSSQAHCGCAGAPPTRPRRRGLVTHACRA